MCVCVLKRHAAHQPTSVTLLSVTLSGRLDHLARLDTEMDYQYIHSFIAISSFTPQETPNYPLTNMYIVKITPYVLPLPPPPAPAPGPLGLLAPPPLGAAPLGRLMTLGPVPTLPVAAPWILPNILSAGGFCSAGVVSVVFVSPISPSSGAGRLSEVGDVGVVWDRVALTADN